MVARFFLTNGLHEFTILEIITRNTRITLIDSTPGESCEKGVVINDPCDGFED